MNDQWYFGSDGQQRGPVTGDEIRQRLAAGAIRPDDLVWREGMAEWTPAASVPEFAGAIGTAPTSIAPPVGQPASNPYDSAHQALGYYAATQGGVEYVGFWWRVLAAIIDSVITGIAGAIVGGITGGLIGVAMGTDHNAAIAIRAVAQVLGIAIGWLYSALLESSPQQATLGKMAIGVRVTDLNGARLTFARATGRFFAKYVNILTLGIGFLMVGFTQRKQGLHDMIAGTLVVRGRANTVPVGYVAAPTAVPVR